MKKLVALVLVVILTLSVFTVSLAAEGKTFDVKMLEGKDGYEYDKFDKDWSYYQAYLKKFNDARVVIGLQVDGDAESV